MGRRGPKPKPTAILAARGSRNAKRENEPIVELGAPEEPATLTGEARLEWRRLVPILEGMGVLARADREALRRLCESVALWHRLASYVYKHGVEGERGGLSAQAQMLNQVSTRILALEQEFGLTPSARARIKIAPETTREAVRTAGYFRPTKMGG